MSQSVQGNTSAGVAFTTTFATGTAGKATEVNNLGSAIVSVGPGQPAGLQVTDCFSATYTNISAPFDIDLTNLPGIGGRAIDLPGVKIYECINCDPAAGHDVQLSTGASNGFVLPTATVLGGLPGAGITNGQAVGNKLYATAFTGSGWPVDSTHKVITVTPITTSVSVAFTGGGGTGATAGTVTITAGVITAIAVSAGGTGYTVAPTVAITGGGGSGATATATISGGAVTGIVITAGGTGYKMISAFTLVIAG